MVKFQTEKQICYYFKRSIFQKILTYEYNIWVSKKISSYKNHKYYIGYLYGDYNTKPLDIMLPKRACMQKIMMRILVNGYIFWLKMIIYGRNIIVFGVNYQISTDVKRKPINEPAYNKRKLKQSFTVLKILVFTIKKVPKVNFSYTWLAVISLDSIFEMNKNYGPHVFLKECTNMEKSYKTYYWWPPRFFWLLWWIINWGE